MHGVNSILDGIGTLDEYAKLAKEKNHKSVALTDHGKMSGYHEHQKSCDKYGVKPIFGVEAYVVDNLITLEGEKRIRGKNNHLILLAKDSVGYKNMLKLNYMSFADDSHFYYNNRFSHEELFEHSQGIMIGTACIASPFAYKLAKQNEIEAEKIFKMYLDVFKSNMYVEVQINEITNKMDNLEKGQYSVNEFLIKLAKKYDAPICLTGDVHYANKADAEIQKLSLLISQKKTVFDTDGFELEGKNLFYQDTDDFLRLNKEFNYNYPERDLYEWMDNTDIIAEQCNFIMKQPKRMRFPNLTDDDDLLLITKSREGLEKKIIEKQIVNKKEYRDRLNYELEVILRKGFASYMMVLWDIFQFTEKENIMSGSGRGCFLPNEMVSMLDGSSKQIKDVIAGEMIKTGLGLEMPVKNVLEYDCDENVSKIKLKNNEEINCTSDHKIFVVKKGLDKKIENAKWVKAEEIKKGDFLVKNL